MKSNLKRYIAIWLLLLVVFNVVHFVVPDFYSLKYVFEKFTNKFWAGYISGSVGMLIHLLFVTMQSNSKKHNTGIMAVSFYELVFFVIACFYFMILRVVSFKIQIVINIVFIVISTIVLLVVDMIEKNKENANEKLNKNLYPYKNLMNKVNSLVLSYPDNQNLKKLCDEMKYSDPSSDLYVDEIEKILSYISNENIDEISERALFAIMKRNDELKLEKHYKKQN